jgi:hypothetical protein
VGVVPRPTVWQGPRMSDASERAPASATLGTALSAGAPWAVLLIVVTAALASAERISRNESHFNRMLLAGAAVVLVVLSAWLRPFARSHAERFSARSWQAARRALASAWVVAALFGLFNYYQFDRRVAATVGDYADATYYYLNSKFFPELGYTRLYEAMLVADGEGPRNLAGVRRYRDLVGYQLLPRRAAFEDGRAIKAHFSPARWALFKTDLAFITAHAPDGGWGYFFVDHGYNPPPVWTLVGGTLAELCDVQHLKWITSIDALLVAGMMVAIYRAFGSQALFVALAFFLCTFSGRWPILGQAILRFDWLVALVLSVVCLKRRRHGLAGALLAYATSVRVFPAVFALPYAALVLRSLWRERRLAPEHVRFIGGAVICALALNGAAVARYGVDAYREAIAKIELHSSPESFSSHRVGLGAALLYRGEWSRQDMDERGGIDAKRDALWELEPYLKVVGLLSAILVMLYAWRARIPVHRLIWLGAFPLFCMTNPQINYYNLRLLLVLDHAEHPATLRARLGLALLFAIEAGTQAMHVAGATRYAVTATSSWGMLVYLLAMSCFLVHDFAGATTKQPVTRSELSGPTSAA